MSDKRTSIQPTYDSRETGARYWVTSTLNGKPVAFRSPTDDPFVRHTVHVGWRDLLKSLIFRRGLDVVVTVGGDPAVMEDVMELDSNYLGVNCTRRDVFNSHLNERLGAFISEQSGETPR
jgi:hypothetical protein